jgi:PAS domain S-box-containing protein
VAESLDAHRLEALADAVEHVPIAIIATDRDGIVTHWTAHAERIYGWARDEVLGRPIMEITVGPTSRSVAESIVAKVAAGVTWEGEFTARRRDGSEVGVHVIDLPVHDGGQLTGIVGMSVDVTRERDLLEAEAALEETLAGAELRTRQLERSRVARELHDDLGQHLTMLRTELLGAIERDGVPDAAQIERLLVLTDAGLDRLHSIILDLAPSELRFAGLGTALSDQLDALSARTGIRTVLDADHRPLAGAHARGLYRIVQGLLTNCERHAGATVIEVRLVDEGEDLRLEVRDDGVGIGPEANGFGLASIRTRAEELGGEFHIGRDPQGGTVATLLVRRPPRAKEQP